MSNYTLEIKKIFHTMRPPFPGFIVDMVEYRDSNELALRVYRDNVESFSQPQKVALAEYLYQLRDAINDCGVKCFIEGVEKSPPNLQGLGK